jgi:long-chain acyl-CoA synthetase
MERVAQGLVEAVGSEYAGIHFALLPLPVLLENVAGLYTTLLAGGLYHVPRLHTVGFNKAFAPDFGVLARSLGECCATSTILVPELLRGLAATLHQAGLDVRRFRIRKVRLFGGVQGLLTTFTTE